MLQQLQSQQVIENFQLHYNLMDPPSSTWSILDLNVVMGHMTVSYQYLEIISISIILLSKSGILRHLQFCLPAFFPILSSYSLIPVLPHLLTGWGFSSILSAIVSILCVSSSLNSTLMFRDPHLLHCYIYFVFSHCFTAICFEDYFQRETVVMSKNIFILSPHWKTNFVGYRI